MPWACGGSSTNGDGFRRGCCDDDRQRSLEDPDLRRLRRHVHGREPRRSPASLLEIGAEREEAEAEELSEQLQRVPDLTKALREASPKVQRQVFQAFELQILCDKAERRIEVSATVSEAVADAFEEKKASRRRAPWWY